MFTDATSPRRTRSGLFSRNMARAGYGVSYTSRCVPKKTSLVSLKVLKKLGHLHATQAYKAVGESTEIPLTYYENNVAATLYLLQIMDEFDCRQFVYSSSATVYGTPPIIPIPETTKLIADSPYGKTKVMAETIVDDLCHGMFLLPFFAL